MEKKSAIVRNPAWSLLRDLIDERMGILFEQDNLDLMAGKVSELMAELDVDSPLDYYYLLKYEGNADKEWSKLVNAISVRETYFWREVDQIHTLVDIVVPRLMEVFSGPLRIWSAASASGEEPISIAMALDQAHWFDRVEIEIHATDISTAAIAAAERGIYRERAFRTLPVELRDRYFKAVPDGWKVDPKLQRRIRFHRANLLNKSDIEELARSRIIFCRNVFIYFSEATIRKVLKTYEECMPRPGYLFVGAAESLLKFSTEFELQQIGSSFVYVKE